MQKGKLIVIDGTDGSGKATQTELLVKRLRAAGHRVEFADFPRYGERSATLVEDYLNGKFGDAREVGPYRASTCFACDRYAASFTIRKWLDEGAIVVCNRYVSANMGHQAGKIADPAERDKFLDWLDNLEYTIFGIPRPDKNILLYLQPEIGQQLVDKKGSRDYVGGKKRDIHEADIQHLRDAAEAFLYVAKKYAWDVIECAPGGNLRTVEDISDELWKDIQPLLQGTG